MGQHGARSFGLSVSVRVGKLGVYEQVGKLSIASGKQTRKTKTVSRKGLFPTTGFSLMRWLMALLILTACERDLDKLQRLDSERLIQCLNAEAEYEALQKARPDPRKRTPSTDSLAFKWVERQSRCELATREYERFKR